MKICTMPPPDDKWPTPKGLSLPSAARVQSMAIVSIQKPVHFPQMSVCQPATFLKNQLTCSETPVVTDNFRITQVAFIN